MSTYNEGHPTISHPESILAPLSPAAHTSLGAGSTTSIGLSTLRASLSCVLEIGGTGH